MVIEFNTDGTKAATLLIAFCRFGCGSSTAVPIPGADDVITAPAVSVDLPPATEVATANAATQSTAEREPESAAASTTTEAPNTSATPPPEPAPATSAAPPADAPVDEEVFLRLGDEGPEVATMQRKLASIDYLPAGSDTGVFDETTRSGLRRFQDDYGLGVDGIFGAITGRALNAAVSSINSGG